MVSVDQSPGLAQDPPRTPGPPLPYTPTLMDRLYGGPRPMPVSYFLADEGEHVPRPHKKGYPVEVCAYCSSMSGDGDGLDGFYVPWPCEVLAFLQHQREYPDPPTTAALLASLREIERWTSDPRARDACGRLIRRLEQRP